MNRVVASLLLVGGSLLLAPLAASAVTIDWTPIGNPGNAADISTGYGAVAYNYSIDKYEVTNSQYAAFLNAVAASDTYGLYPTAMLNIGIGDLAGITRSGTPGSYSYNVKPGFANRSVNYVLWGNAARFANWLQNGQPGLGGSAVPQDTASTEDGAYTLNGAISNAAMNAVTRNADAAIFIPSEDEWYKAAYYSPSGSYFQYPTSSNTTPSNAYVDAGNNANFYNHGYMTSAPPRFTNVGHFTMSESPYGTFDQGGNVMEWNEALIDGSSRGLRGGSFDDSSDSLRSSSRNSFLPAYESPYYWIYGFRVASVAGPQFPGDVNFDSVVDFTDLNILLTNYGLPSKFATGDFDNSGTVDFTDLNALLTNYGSHAPALLAAAPIPEPSTLALATLGALGMIIAKWRKRCLTDLTP